MSRPYKYLRLLLIIGISFLISQNSFSVTIDDVTADSTTCSYKNDGSLTINVSGSPNYDYRIYINSWPWSGGTRVDSLLNTSLSSVTFNNLAARTYYIIAEDGGGPDFAIATIEEPDSFIVNRISIYKALSCADACDGKLLAEVSGGTTPYTFTWEEFGVGVMPGQTDSIADNLCQGIYIVQVNDANNCGVPVANYRKSYPFIKSNPFAADSIPDTLKGGTVGSSYTICYNSDVPAFTSSEAATGGSGTYIYTWQYSTTSSTPGVGSWTDIPASNFEVYDYGSLTQTTNFVRRAIDPVCGTVYSNVLTVTVYSQFLPGTVAADQNICYNTDPAAFTSTAPASGGGGFNYQWQDSISGGAWTNIGGATAATYDEAGNLTQTTYYRRAATSTQSCGTVYSNILTVTVYPQLLPGTVAADQNICYNTDPAAFTSTAPASGGGGFNYQWQDSISGGAWANIGGATAATFDESSNLTQTTYYRRTATSTQGCGTVYSNVLTVTVYGQLQPGTIAADQNICYNTDPAAFTSTAPATGGGTIQYQWQDSISGGAWANIAGATAATYDEAGNLTQTTYYRRMVTSLDGCGTDYSNVLTVTVYAQLQPGTVAADQNICYNTDPAAFTSTAPASGGGGFNYQWQDSISGGAWTNIGGATTAVYDEAGNLTQTTYYRRAATSTQGCGTVYSNILTVTVYPQLLPGTVAADQNICYNTDPAAFTSTAPASGGGGFNYQWQDSISGGAWANIGGATAATFDESSNLTQTTYYRRTATSTQGCGTVYSNVLTVTVYGQLQPGTIAADQNICYNTDPAAFTSTAPATGGGTVQYQWQDSISGGAWTNIGGATAATYDEAGNLTQTTYYRRMVTSLDGCGTDYSNVLTVTVYAQLQPGTVAADQNICYNTDPAAFTSTAPASGGGGFNYQWQDSISGGAWTNIGGATAATFDESSNLTQTTYYRRAATSTQGCGTVYSNILTVTVYPQLLPGTVAADQNICYNTDPAAFTSTAPASGGGGFNYQWQDSISGGAWANIGGATAATLDESSNLTQTTYYRRTATSTQGCGTVYSNVLTVTVYGQLQPGTIAADQNICYNTDPAAFTSTAPATGGGTVQYQWQDSISGGAWTNIGGATAATYDEAGNLTQTTYYRRAATSTQGCGTVYSNILTVTVYPQLLPGTVAADQNICYNTDPAAFTSTAPASGGGGFNYQWQDSISGGAWANIGGATAATFDESSNLTQTTYYRRAATSTQGCGTVYSNILTVTVYPQLLPGTVAADQNICYNTDPAAFTSTAPASGGGGFNYQWQDSISGGAWANIGGATAATFDESNNLTQTTYYRRTATSTQGCGTVYSNVLTVTVYGQLQPGTIAADQNICYNTDPAAFTSTAPATGGGTVQYQWQDSISGGAWANIAGATAATYDEAGNLTQTTYYRRMVTSLDGCGTDYSNVLTVTVYSQFLPGTVAADQNICYNTDPAAFTSTAPASGGGGFNYQWQDSISGGAWANIGGATAATFDESSNLTQTTYYRRTATSTQGCGTVYSNILTVTVYPQLLPGTVAADQNICYNTDPAAFTSTAPATGGGTVQYQWQDSISGGAWANIGGATAATFDESNNLTQTTYYRRMVTSLDGCGIAYSNILTVTVIPELNPGVIQSDQTICSGSVPAGFTSFIDAFGGGGVSYQWQRRINAGAWTDIAGATGTNYSETNPLTEITYYHRIARSTAGCGEDTSNVLTVTVDQPPTAYAGTDDTVCYSETEYYVPSASVTNSINYLWTHPGGDGYFDLGMDDILDPTYVFGNNDKAMGAGSLVTLVLEADGMGTCSGVSATDTMHILIPQELDISVGVPTPFLIDSDTRIEVVVQASGRITAHDLGYFLVSPSDSVVELKAGEPPFPICSWGNSVDVTFRVNPTPPITLNQCSFPGNITGTFAAVGDWSALYGQDPANGNWRVMLTDELDFPNIDPDGQMDFVSISFTDTALSGELVTLTYDNSGIVTGINPSPSFGVTGYTYFAPTLGLSTTCFNTCDATALVTTTGGIGTHTIEWSDGLGSATTIDLCAGTYTVKVTDEFGCVDSTIVNVTSPPAINIDEAYYTDSLSCYADSSGSITVKASGGTGALSYTLLPENIVSASADSGYFNNLTAGTKTVRVEDANGCFVDTVFYIAQPAQLVLDTAYVSDSVFCSGDNNGRIVASASGGTPPYVFVLEPVSVVNDSGIFTNLGPGSYVVKLTDNNSCDTVYSDILILGTPTPLAIDTVIANPIICNGDLGSIQVVTSGGNPPYDISINGGGVYFPGLTGDELFPDLGAGNYDVQVRDSKGCIDIWPVTITLVNPPVLVIDSVVINPVTTCYTDSTGSFTVYSSGGAGTHQYSINGGPLQASNIFNNLPGGNYIILVEDSLGCFVITPQTMTSPPQLLGNPIVVHVQGATLGSITYNATGGTPGTPPNEYRYAVNTDTSYTNVFSDLDVGIYNLYVEDSVGCIWDSTVTIIENELDIDFVVTDVSCAGAFDGEIILYFNDGIPPFNYSYNGGTEYIHNFPVPSSAALPSLEGGNYNMHVEDGSGREYDTLIVINEPPPIDISITETNPTCNEYELDGSISMDGSLSVTSSGGAGSFTYSWADSQTPDSIRNNLSPGFYTVTVTDANDCSSDNTHLLLGQIAINAWIGEDTTVCYLDVLPMRAEHTSGSFNYLWGPDSLFDINADLTDIQHYVTVRGNSTYSVRVYNSQCYDTAVQHVSIFDTVGIQIFADVYGAGDSIFVPLNTSANLWVNSGFDSYTWFPTDGLSTPFDSLTEILIGDNAVYTINAVTPDNCTERDTVWVIIQLPVVIEFNAFSPNGDGVNDYWEIPNAVMYPELTVEIYNRWGQQVFFAQNYGISDTYKWDGKSQKNGKDLPVGTYYYVIRYTEGTKEVVLNGTVTIVR